MTVNPYKPPIDREGNQDTASARGPDPVKWIVATVGAVIVTGGSFMAILLLPLFLFPVVYKSTAGLVALYIVGVPLAIAAGVISFMATLRLCKMSRD